MANQPTPNLSFLKKAGLVFDGILAVAIPVILGITHALMVEELSSSYLHYTIMIFN